MKKQIIVIRSKKGMLYAIDKYVHDNENKRFKFVNLIDDKTNKKYNLNKLDEGIFEVTFNSYKDDDNNITLFGVTKVKEL